MNHFRVVKFFGKEHTQIMDAELSKKINADLSKRNEILLEEDWINYIVLFNNTNESNHNLINTP